MTKNKIRDQIKITRKGNAVFFEHRLSKSQYVTALKPYLLNLLKGRIGYLFIERKIKKK